MYSLKLPKLAKPILTANNEKKSYTDFSKLPIMLNADDLAKILRISRAGAYNLFRLEGFPTNKINGRSLVAKADLIEWLRKNKR